MNRKAIAVITGTAILAIVAAGLDWQPGDNISRVRNANP